MKHRFSTVKKTGDLDERQWDDLTRMFDYLPELRMLWHFATEVNDLFEKEGRVQTLYKRRAALLRKGTYREVPELEEAMGMLEEGKFEKMVAFTSSEAGKKVRTNNHVERANRRLRFAEKVRYKWRHRKWVLRHVLLALDRWWCQAARATQQVGRAAGQRQRPYARAS